MSLRDLLGKKIILFDGAMGTMILKSGLKTGELPEILNFTNPDIIENIHRKYAEAGSDIITTNTFGANDFKLEGTGYTVEQVVRQAVKIAKKAAMDKYVALDISSLGKIMEPTGELTFERAYEAFKKQIVAGAEAGADLILIETISDIYEMRAAVLAAKENCDLPIFCSVTFQEDGRMLMGTDPLTMVNILQDMGVDALGLNCSLGPKQIFPIVLEVLKYSRLPVLVQPNAGLPTIVNGETVFEIEIEPFAEAIKEMIRAGAQIVGGCCGTTPEYIARVRKEITDLQPVKRETIPFTAVSSSTKTVMLDHRIRIIGERINPTGKKKLKEALIKGDLEYVLDEALKQVDCGAEILDVNMGLPDINEKEMMIKAIKKISSTIDTPLQIDSSNPSVIEEAVRTYNGKPVINSVNGKQSNMDAIFPIVKKYGACVIALTLDERGLPKNCEERVEIADKIIKCADKYGIGRDKIIVDCLTLTVSAQQDAAIETLNAIKQIKEKYGVKTTLGASNISFGLPERKILNKTFLATALAFGLDAPITDPTEKEYLETIKAFEVLSNKDVESKDYIQYFSAKEAPGEVKKISKQEKEPENLSLEDIIIKGYDEKSANATRELLKSLEPLNIVSQYIVPSLEIVGKKYETGDIFLPQLIKSAETVKNAFDVLKQKMKETNDSMSYGKIVMATVKGDIHDIGKNIVKVLLENHGYDVIDLGKDVPPETIVETVQKEKVKLVGLSALMTTTVVSMEETIQMLRSANCQCKVMVGGAVLTEEYAKKIGADYYCKDGMAGVRVAKEVFNK